MNKEHMAMIEEDDVPDFIKAMFGAKVEQETFFTGNAEKVVQHLHEHGYPLIQQRPTFRPGQVVCWHAGLRNRAFPYGTPMMVVEQYDEPFVDHEINECGSLQYREPIDVRVAVADPGHGDILEWVLDSRRLKLHPDFIPD